MRNSIFTTEYLAATQSVASSIVPVVLGSSGAGNNPFSINLSANSRIAWEVIAIFRIGATGGFRFLADGPAAPAIYNASYEVIEVTTPEAFVAAQVAEADFVADPAISGDYQLQVRGTFVNGATPGLFSFKFAQSTIDPSAIMIRAGAMFRVWQF